MLGDVACGHFFRLEEDLDLMLANRGLLGRLFRSSLLQTGQTGGLKALMRRGRS